MTDAGAILRQQRTSTLGDLDRPERPSGLIYRFRRAIVAASLVSCDLVAAFTALWFSNFLLSSTGVANAEPRYGALAVLVLALFAVGLYRGSGPSSFERFRQRTIAIAGFLVIDTVVALPSASLSGLAVAESCKGLCLLVFGHYAESALQSLLIRADLWGASTVLIGCGEASRDLARFLMRQPDLGLRPVGFVKSFKEGELPRVQLPLPVIGTTADLDRTGPDTEVAIFTTAKELAALTCASEFRMPSCQFLLVENVHDVQCLWLRTRMLDKAIAIEIRRDSCLRHNQVLKRLFDLLLATPLLCFFAPLIALLALAIKIVDPGPAFFSQDRVGPNGAGLRVLKLRTMYANAEERLEEHLRGNPRARAEWQRFFKLSSDPRVLPLIGSLMRRSSLDELPQLWNVIRGDMSLVGPRPLPSYHVGKFDAQFQAVRLSVPSGITGMWQISSRSDGDLEMLREQDLFYIRNWSLWLDFYILLETPIAVLSTRGAR